MNEQILSERRHEYMIQRLAKQGRSLVHIPFYTYELISEGLVSLSHVGMPAFRA
jgi:hypothetical protein